MSKLTKSYKSNFTTVPNHIINDKTISLKAKGIYLFLISKPDNWVFSVDRIAFQNSDGENSVRTALKELETKRFLKRVQINKRGVFGENDYIIFDEPYPSDENHLTVKSTPSDDSRRSVSRRSENRRTLVKTNLVKEERENNITSPIPEIIDEIKSCDIVETDFDQVACNDVFLKYPHAYAFVNHCLTTTRRVHSPVAFKASLFDALGNPDHKKHNMTIMAYYEFVNQNNYLISNDSNFPDLGDKLFDLYENGLNVFDVIGRE